MKFLSRIILKNFQSHEYSIIEFDQGLNVIVGPSDTGKTAIIRAMKWVFYNEPAGDYFIREGENECSVIAEFDDGTKVERYRSKSKNMYILYDNYGSEIRYEGFGTSVPEEILEATNIRKISLDSNGSNAINIGEQLEGPFLLSEKTSTRASAIGRLIGVNIIDEALVETLKDLRSYITEGKTLKENIEILNIELKSYDYLKEISKKTDKVSKIKDILKTKSHRLSSLNIISKQIKEIETKIKELNIYLEKLIYLDELSNLIDRIKELENYFKYLNNKNNILEKYRQDIIKDKKILKGLEYIDVIERNYYILEKEFIRKSKLDGIKGRIDLNEKSIFEVNTMNQKLGSISRFEDIVKLIENDIINLLTYNKIRNNLGINKKNLSIGRKYIEQFKNVDYAINIYEEIDQKIKVLTEYKGISKKINNYRQNLKKEKDIEHKSDAKIKEKLERYRRFLESVEVCPVCLSDINNDKIEHILKHYK